MSEFRKPKDTEKSDLAIKRYYKLKRPIKRITVFSFVIFFCFLGAFLVFMPDTIKLDQNHLADRVTFILYGSIFIANWLVYFRSKKTYYKRSEDGIQSLRRLLGETSKQWQTDGFHDYSREKHEAFKNKSSTAMTVISIQIAIAILILTLIQNAFYSTRINLDDWQNVSLQIAAILAIISFFSFSVSIDALDTIFNRFKEGSNEDVLIHYFYSFTINPKYFGMVSMLSAVIMIMQVYSETIASLSIAIAMFFGYYLWYPKLDGAMIECGLIAPDKQIHSFQATVLRLVEKFMVMLFLLLPLSLLQNSGKYYAT